MLNYKIVNIKNGNTLTIQDSSPFNALVTCYISNHNTYYLQSSNDKLREKVSRDVLVYKQFYLLDCYSIDTNQ